MKRCAEPGHKARGLRTLPPRLRQQPRPPQLRYDLAKLRAKGLVAKLRNSRRYRLLPQGYSICLIFLKLFERVYAPLTPASQRPSGSKLS
jgi:hypothetical protein